jgi:hypothetical protein
MPVIDVDRDTYVVLQLAQAAIHFTRHALPYGSGNQIPDLQGTRTGGVTDGTTRPRVKAIRRSKRALLKEPHAPLGPLGLDDRTYALGLGVGLAMYYGAGNCSEHASLTFAFMATFGFPGITLRRCSSTLMDHVFTIVTWGNPNVAVVADAWPSKPQACLWAQFFASPTHMEGNPPGFKEKEKFKVTDQNMGFDLVGQAYRAIDPAVIEQIRPQSRIKGYTDQQIEDYINSEPDGLYDQEYSVAEPFEPAQDYRYNGERLSKALLPTERWTGYVQRAITEVNKHPRMLDPTMRYTGMGV